MGSHTLKRRENSRKWKEQSIHTLGILVRDITVLDDFNLEFKLMHAYIDAYI